MSTNGKIKSKDLSYDSTLPPFLQRLHAQKAGRGDLDRQERPIARPRLAKDHQDDDGPTVVDESGETLTKDEFEKLAEGSNDTLKIENLPNEYNALGDDPVREPSPEGQETARRETKVTTGTASNKKRKMAKVIGEDPSHETGDGDAPNDHNKIGGSTKKAKRKVKPIKLAFDEEDDT